MKRFNYLNLVLILLLNLPLISYGKAEDTKTLDKIVAIVNDDVITQSELNHAVNIINEQAGQEAAAQNDTQNFTKQVLQQLIDTKLQLQIAKQMGLEASKKDVSNAINRIAEQNHISTEALYDELKREGMTPSDYRAEISKQITIQKLQQHELLNKIAITPEEVEQFLKRYPREKTATEYSYEINDYLIALPEKPNSDVSHKANLAALKLIATLKSNKTISTANLQKIHKKITKNTLGWRKKNDLPSIFSNAISDMNTAGVKGPIAAPNGLHVLQIVNVRAIDADNNIPTKKQAEQILLQRKFAEEVKSWLAQLRSQAYIVFYPDK